MRLLLAASNHNAFYGKTVLCAYGLYLGFINHPWCLWSSGVSCLPLSFCMYSSRYLFTLGKTAI